MLPSKQMSNLQITITCEKANFTIFPVNPGDDFSYLPYIEKNRFH